ncbi:6-bladed beta-propeller [Flavivirga rizhaonensis]|uniref:6-bladed beta-propeller n=1 Tax=Flavivirga rizhaonensis TaxID=2559571 RepID=A0A4S1DYX6_9FLAO|nr:6-bladed beta-propeller [Flavivirga rizhaonensis]TGV03427.1 6-bladed beta-propeller [Flavivirga rizhaonensis]
MKFYIIIFLITIISCTKENRELDGKVIDLANTYNQKPLKVNLSEIASEIEYIQLQTSDKSLLNRIDNESNNIKFFNKKILIKDKLNSLLLFNFKGEFLSKIGALGKGPGEYLKIDGFTILTEEESIVINSRQEKKMRLYDYSGIFKNDFSTKFQTNNIFSFNNHLISVNNFDFRKYSGYNNLSVFSKEGELKSQLLFKSFEKSLGKKNKNYIHWSYNSRAINTYNLKGKQFFWEYGLYDSKDTIWEINSDFIPKPSHIFHFGGKKPAMKSFFKDKKPSINELSKLTGIIGFIDTSNSMFIELGMLDKKIKIYRDKKVDMNIRVGYKIPSTNSINFSFYNDIDEGMPFWPDGMVSENKIFKLVYGYEIKRFLKENIAEDKDTIHERKKRLRQMVENAKIYDNPILMIVTLKD